VIVPVLWGILASRWSRLDSVIGNVSNIKRVLLIFGFPPLHLREEDVPRVRATQRNVDRHQCFWNICLRAHNCGRVHCVCSVTPVFRSSERLGAPDLDILIVELMVARQLTHQALDLVRLFFWFDPDVYILRHNSVRQSHAIVKRCTPEDVDFTFFKNDSNSGEELWDVDGVSRLQRNLPLKTCDVISCREDNPSPKSVGRSSKELSSSSHCRKGCCADKTDAHLNDHTSPLSDKCLSS